MPRIAIIADDLTGALDSAAPMSGGGAAVATSPAGLAEALEADAAVVAVSTRSREIPWQEAQKRVETVLAALPSGIRIVKKIDSRMKGNIAAELAPLASHPFLVLPAIPDFGRVVRQGQITGFGIESPIRVADALGRFAAGAAVPDTATQADMLAAVSAASAECALVGARGLAQALGEIEGLLPLMAPDAIVRPIVFVVGSTDPISLEQVDVLRQAVPDWKWVPAPAGELPSPPRGFSPGGVTLLQAVPGRARPASQVAADFARTAAPWLAGAATVVLTGGATAEAVLDALGMQVLHVRGEALPGLPWCRAGDKVFITKSGGFGPPDTLSVLAARARP